MTNNQLTKEWLQNRIADMESTRDDIPFGFDEDGNNELAAFKLALAAMDSKPVAEVVSVFGDSESIGERELKLLVGIQNMPYGTKFYRHAQPAPVVSADLLHSAASAIEDLLTTKDRTGAGVWFDLPFKLRSAANAQQPVVPDVMEPTIEAIKRILPTSNPDEYAACIGADMWNACRAAMLAAAPHDTPALNSLQSVDSVAGKWIPVSERMPEEDTDVVVYCSDTEEQFVAYHNCNGYFHYATYEKKGEGYVDIVCNPTHWMPLPAAPQEVR